jgi:hypothetical protein
VTRFWVKAMAVAASLGLAAAGMGAVAPTAGASGAIAPGCDYAAHPGAAGQEFRNLTPQARAAAVLLCDQGVLTGTAPDVFSPYLAVTRAQAAKFVVRALGASLVQGRAQAYPDVSPSSPYYAFVQTASALGILPFAPSGGDFQPTRAIARQEFAAMAVDALGHQVQARSLAGAATHFRDDAAIAPAYRGDVNEALRLGLVPPLDAALYAPGAALNRVELALGLERLMADVQAARPASLSLAAAQSTVGVGAVDLLVPTVVNRFGHTLAFSSLAAAGDDLVFRVEPSRGANVTVTSAGTGTFVATAAGSYDVVGEVVSPNGRVLASGSANVLVYGSPAAIDFSGASTIPADGAGTVAVTATVVDARGATVADYSGPVTLTDSGQATTIVAAGDAPVSGPVTARAVAGVATFTLQSTGTAVGVTDTLTASAGAAQGSTTLTTVAPAATSLEVQAPAVLPVNSASQATTTVDAVVVDQAGVAMRTGSYPVTFSVQGPATIQGSATATYTGNGTTQNTSAQATVVGTVGTPGTITVDASAPGLPAASATMRAMLTGAAFFSGGKEVSALNRVTVSASAPVAVTLEALGPNGNPAPAAADETFAVGDEGAGGTFSLTPGGGPVTQVTIPAGSQGVTVEYQNANAGSYVLLASPVPTFGGGGGGGGSPPPSGGGGGAGGGGGGGSPPTGSVTVPEPPLPSGATNPPVAIEATFDQNGSAVAYESVPVSDFNGANDTVTFSPPTLPAGTYQVYVSFSFTTTVVVAGPVAYTAP